MHSFGFSTHCFYSGSVYNLFMYIYNLIMYIEQEEYADQINYNKKIRERNMTIAVDFDGTIVEHRYPEIGNEIIFATDTLKMLINDGHRLILWSVREGELLDEAVEWCRQRGVEFYAVNKDFPEEDVEKNEQYSRKLRVDLFIDDRNVGGLPDWGTIYQIIKERKTYKQILQNQQQTSLDNVPDDRPRRKWWQFR